MLQSVIAFFRDAQNVTLVFTIVNALIAFSSARSAGKAAHVASEALREQNDARQQTARMRLAERNSEYYRALLADTVLEAVPLFRREVLMLVNEMTAKLCALPDATPQAAVRACAAEFTTRFNVLHDPLAEQLFARAKAWGDEELRVRITTAVTDMQDDITARVKHALAEPHQAREEISRAIDAHTTDLIALVVRWDLDAFRSAMEPPEPPSVNGPVELKYLPG
jgi:hypothetical protein